MRGWAPAGSQDDPGDARGMGLQRIVIAMWHVGLLVRGLIWHCEIRRDVDVSASSTSPLFLDMDGRVSGSPMYSGASGTGTAEGGFSDLLRTRLADGWRAET
jgi:hypothetical protein